ncbi:hypothetical protein C7999DRAFT_39006 [Corynascus novoguineensis]|uniref:Uncharacterized protein n=1 Tax=Corynascus novoguineensis TaxID=1126955 RepID=A0AAN7CYY5_9PEZI|nr:hypothetical protein C7999DRAFT_39006 [Corynascus novoguineensis]
MESPFSDAEKRFLLAEMIRLSPLNVGILVDFVRSHGIQPDWLNMQVPSGRTLSQCLQAAEIMLNTPMQPPSPLIPSLKRKSLGDLPDYGGHKRQAVLSPGELSPHGFAPGPQSAPTAQPVNIQPRPNGYAPALQSAGAPSVSAAPYNPAPTARRRGRPPKSAQNSWQVTYPPLSPAPSVPHPNSPGLQSHTAHQAPAQAPPDPKRAKKSLPEIAPRPAQGLPTMEPGDRSPAVPGADYQNWRDETTRRENYQLQATEPSPRERSSTSAYPPIQPRPRSPLPPPRELARAASKEPRHFTATPPPIAQEPAKKEGQPTTTDQIKT